MHLEYFIILFVFILFFGFSSCNAGVYLAINALAYTEDNGNGEIVKRRLEVNWYGDEVYYLQYHHYLKLINVFNIYRSQMKI